MLVEEVLPGAAVVLTAVALVASGIARWPVLHTQGHGRQMVQAQTDFAELMLLQTTDMVSRLSAPAA